MPAREAGVKLWSESNADSEEVPFAFLGDCVEGVVSQRGRHIGKSDLALTEELRVLRLLFTQNVARLADASGIVTITSVPGNHDETHRSLVDAKPHDLFAVDSLRAVQ